MRQLSPRRAIAGFTMMELLIVLVIIGLLAALVGPILYQRIKPAKQSVAQAQIQNFMTALDGFFVDLGRYPHAHEGLLVLRERPEQDTGWHGPYMSREIPLDPWGAPFQYRTPGRSGGYEIFSFGADGREGGEGEASDITSWSSLKQE
jgi:general secretion pathway protein G